MSEHMTRTLSQPRAAGTRGQWLVVSALALTLVAPPAVGRIAAQAQVQGGDFDICDNLGTLRGNTAFLVGRAGFGTTNGEFVLVNAATSDQDCDHDGYTP